MSMRASALIDCPLTTEKRVNPPIAPILHAPLQLMS
jgi:hypothetical protein